MPTGLSDLALRTAAALAVVAAASGCGTAGNPVEPIGASSVEGGQYGPSPSADALRLGVSVVGGRAAGFATTGGTVSVRITDMDHGPLFDRLGARSAAYIGPFSSKPIFDEQRSTVPAATRTLDLVEGNSSTVELPAGTYWLWTSNSGQVDIRGCGSAKVTSHEDAVGS